jgi:glutathione S-transferase
MLVLRSAAASPFGQKVKIAAAVLGLSDQLEVATANTLEPTDPLRQHNPFGKIPCLTTEYGTAIYDRRTLGYLDPRFDRWWRQSHPKLVAWLDLFAKDIAALEATRFLQAA